MPRRSREHSEQYVAASEKSYQYFADQVVVADDDFLNFAFQALENLAKLLRLHHSTFLLRQRIMPRYSIGTCCFSLGALGTSRKNLPSSRVASPVTAPGCGTSTAKLR